MGTGIDVWNELQAALAVQDYNAFASLFANDAVYGEPEGRHEGRDATRSWMHEQDGAFPDVSYDVSRVIEHAEVVVAEWTYRGTHTRPMTMPDGSAIPPTGKTSVTPGVTILTVTDGKGAAARDYFDLPIGMSQLGLTPGS